MDKCVLILVLLLRFRCEASPDCDSYTTCETCTSHTSWLGAAGCRWCPLDRECHAYASLENTCKVYQNIKSLPECSVDHKAYGVYDPKLAYSATLLSAIAYSDTPAKCMNSILPDGGFELLQAVGRRCEDLFLFKYKECYAYTAISHKKKIIVLAYRGTSTDNGISQLLDELVSIFQPKTSFIIGGEVQHYFKQAYEKLFPCVRSSVEETVRQHPDYDVVITGHSLGGALASLSAASLVYTGVVPENKLSLYTFGMPRVGDKDYALRHDKIVNNSWRVVHRRDIVAHLPTCHVAGCRLTASGPYHHRTEIFYRTDPMTASSTYTQCEGDDDEHCSNGLITNNRCTTDIGDCIDYHKVYFGIPVGTYCEEKGSRSKRSTPERSEMWDKFSSDECRRIDISKGSTVNASTKTCKMKEISLIVITLLVLIRL